MEINLADYVGQKVVATQRDGSTLAGMLTDDGPTPFVYKIQGRLFLGNGRWVSGFDISDEDIVNLSLVESPQNTMKDLLTLLSSLTPSLTIKYPYGVRRRENGEYVLFTVDRNNLVTDSIVFSKEGEDTGKGSTTLYDLVRGSKRERALSKLTAEDREVLGL